MTTMSKILKKPPASGGGGAKVGGAGGWKEPQPWEIMKAVERQDIMFLMDVRDRAFHVSLGDVGVNECADGASG